MKPILLFCLLYFSCAGSLLSQGENPFELKNRAKKAPLEQTSKPAANSNNPFEVRPNTQTDSSLSSVVAAPQNSQQTADSPNTSVQVLPKTSGPASANPFDLNRGQNKAGSTDPALNAVDSDTKPTTSNNPFDKGKQEGLTSTAPANNQSGKGASSQIIIRKKAGKREGQHQTFLFWTMLGLLFTGTLVFILFQPFLRKSYRAFTNDNMLKLLQRENSGSITFPYMILYTFFFINAGMFSYLASTHFGFVRENYGSFLLKCIFGIAAFFIIKHLLLSFIAVIFQLKKEIEQYTFTIVVFSIILGIVLVPFNVLTAFSTPAFSQVAFYGAFVVIAAFYLFRFFRSLFIASKFITLSKFHFFMYLCTIEIAPIAILIKVLMNSTGVQ